MPRYSLGELMEGSCSFVVAVDPEAVVHGFITYQDLSMHMASSFRSVWIPLPGVAGSPVKHAAKQAARKYVPRRGEQDDGEENQRDEPEKIPPQQALAILVRVGFTIESVRMRTSPQAQKSISDLVAAATAKSWRVDLEHAAVGVFHAARVAQTSRGGPRTEFAAWSPVLRGGPSLERVAAKEVFNDELLADTATKVLAQLEEYVQCWSEVLGRIDRRLILGDRDHREAMLEMLDDLGTLEDNFLGRIDKSLAAHRLDALATRFAKAVVALVEASTEPVG